MTTGQTRGILKKRGTDSDVRKTEEARQSFLKKISHTPYPSTKAIAP